MASLYVYVCLLISLLDTIKTVIIIVFAYVHTHKQQTVLKQNLSEHGTHDLVMYCSTANEKKIKRTERIMEEKGIMIEIVDEEKKGS